MANYNSMESKGDDGIDFEAMEKEEDAEIAAQVAAEKAAEINELAEGEEEPLHGPGEKIRERLKFDPITEFLIKALGTNNRIEKAWDFFGSVTLPRYIQKEDSDDPNDFRILEPGERGGSNYSLWKTPLRQLGDFGLGMGLYFEMLAIMTVVFLVAGFINLWTIIYFAGDEYSAGQPGISGLLKGSAICNEREVVCTSADCQEWTTNLRPCELKITQGYLDFAATIFMFVVMGVIGWISKKWSERIDEGEQTASDYSVLVGDPTPDATDVEEWREFFESRFGHVSYVTVAVNNGDLMRTLGERRDIMTRIQHNALMWEEEEKAMNPACVMTRGQRSAEGDDELTCAVEDVAWWKRVLMPLGLFRDLVYWHDMLVANEEMLQKLLGPKEAKKVFITFEQESSQRDCLKKMTIGMIAAMVNSAEAVADEYKFRGTNVLSVREAPAPGELNWENLQHSLQKRAKEFLVRIFLTGVVVASAGLIVFGMSLWSASAAAIFISLNNTVIPMILKWITVNPHGGERHHTSSNYQASLMLKIVATQWMNTAFIIYIIQSIYDVPEEEYINQVRAVLWADAFTSPLLIVLDINGRFNRHVMALGAKTQVKTNSFFFGTEVFLAERYASMLKTMFVCLFFSSVFPLGYFVSAMALFMTYWASKYCLFNVWNTPPPVDKKLAELTQTYFGIAVVVHILISLQYYAGWPFDQLCPTDEVVTSPFSDEGGVEDDVATWDTDYTLVLSAIRPVIGDIVYGYCDKDTNAVWGVSTRPWMTSDQRHMVNLFSSFATASTVSVAVTLFGGAILFGVVRLLWGTSVASGVAQKEKFSEVEEIRAYIPEINMAGKPHSLLATDLSRIDAEHISWKGDYSDQNLCSEHDLLNIPEEERNALFSRCVYTPPAGVDVERVVLVEGTEQ